MVEMVGLGSTERVAGPRAAAAPAAVSKPSSPALAVRAAGEGGGLVPVSPSSHADPTTGVLVTQYLSSEGEVQMQIPSDAAMAYLRSGRAAAQQGQEGGRAAEAGAGETAALAGVLA